MFYRDRWSHDKVVRSTHGVNCTGSCSWKVYVKDGIITWETQQTDYPTVGPDSPEYEPRGCPRGAAFSWYTYSPTRVRYPYVRGVLLEAYRTAKLTHPDPVDAWASVVGDPETRRRYQRARGKGGLVRASWPEVLEIIGAAHVHTVKEHGPDRVFGFSPIPAMSMASHAAGARFISLIGGSMLSFYDWYADLPVASPQVFGDQTDVPESADWWNAAYLIMWGSNVPVTRTPDAHFMAEARYRGQKVVTVSPDYADNTKFADEWMSPHPGTDGALAMAMGHVILKEFFIERQVPRFLDYVKKYSDLPFLVSLKERDGAWVPGQVRHVRRPRRHRRGRDLQDRARRQRDRPAARARTARSASGSTSPARASGTSTSRASIPPCRCTARRVPRTSRSCCRASTSARPTTRAAASHRRGVPAARLATENGERLVTTVFDLLLAQYGVGRDGLPGPVAHGLRRSRALHPRLAGGDHRSAGRDGRAHRPRVRAERRGLRRPLDDHHGRRHEPLVPLRHDLPHLPHPDDAVRHAGRERRWLGALRRPGEVPARDGLGAARLRPRLVASAAADDRHRVLVRPDRPVALRPSRRRPARVAARRGQVRRQVDDRHARPVGPIGLDAVVPAVQPQLPRPRRRGGGCRPGAGRLRDRPAEERID